MDIADRAQADEEQYMAARLAERLARVHEDAAGAEICADCGAEIPLERRRAVPSAIRCVVCQAYFERIKNNNRG